MKTVNSIILMLFITLLSCNQKRNFESKKNVLDDSTSYVNYNADSVYYKLSVGFENDDYFQDEKSNLLFLVTREIEVLGKNFGGCQKVAFSKAIDYFIINKDKYDEQTIYEVTTIKIKKKDGTYENVWNYKNNIDVDEKNHSYSIYELKISLEESYARFNNKLESRLHINFKTVDYNNGYKLYTLNYIYNKKTWELVSRERICTIPDDINHEELGYCIDTINYKSKKSGNKFNLTYEDVFNLDSGICNGKL